MAKNVVSKLAKLMADEKVIAILKATKDKRGLTSKEISKRVKIPTSQLYYTVKKMTDEGLLEVTEKKNINNFQEFYYSSYQMTHRDPFLAKKPDSGAINISAEWVEQHSQEVAQMILFHTQQYLDAMQADIKKYAADPDIEKIHAGSFHGQVKITPEDEQKIWDKMLELLQEAQKKPEAKDSRSINFLIEKWESPTDDQEK